MRKRLIVVLVLFLSSLGLLWGQMLGQTIATVNLTKTVGITKSQVDQRMEELKRITSMSGVSPDQITREQVIDSLISEILIRQAAERDNITVDEDNLQQLIDQQKRQIEAQIGRSLSQSEFQNVVQQETGYSWQDYRSQLRDQVLQQTYITQKKRSLFEAIDPPTQKEIEDAYQENATNFTNPEFVRISHVFIRTMNKSEEEQQESLEKIKTAQNKLQSGEMSFDDLVLKYSEDENSKFRGGDVGYVTRNNQQVKGVYGRDFFEKIFTLEAGEVSGLIESNVGYHIVKATEHEPAKILNLDDRIAPDNPTTVREYLRNRLFQEKQQRALQRATQEVMEELKGQAEIARYDN